MIFILDNDLNKSAAMLDDKSLEKQIKNIAQVLCNAHYYNLKLKGVGMALHESQVAHIPLNKQMRNNSECRHLEWSLWAKECKGNYLWLVNYAIICCGEYYWRFMVREYGNLDHDNKCNEVEHYNAIILWARNKTPNLPNCLDKEKCTPDCGRTHCFWDDNHKMIPVIVPKKYFHLEDSIEHPLKPGRMLFQEINLIESNRKFYKSKLISRETETSTIFTTRGINAQWTNQTAPEFLREAYTGESLTMK
jgi:hypothetical protein